jgi:ribonuclease P protein component
MISKNFRLKEEEVKKVLKFWKPFFSYWMVLNYKNNKFENNRFAIIISGKNVDWSVVRNFFRRRFYDAIGKSWFIWKLEEIKTSVIASGSEAIQKKWNNEVNGLLHTSQWQKPSPHYDFVFILKKQTKLDKTKIESINWYDNNIRFLLKAIDKIKLKD